MKILIADDDTTTRRMLRAVLTRLGYEVVEARNGTEAWEHLTGPSAAPLAVLDWMMPGMSGPEVCRKVKGLRRAPEPYVILLTARTHSKDIVAGLDSGADDYVAKPYQVDELRARVAVGRRMLTLQSELVALNEQLEDRVRDRTDRIRGLLEREQELILKLGHDLRTPLTPLMGLLPILVGDEQDAQRRESLVLCLEQVRDLARLAKQVFDLGRLESPRTSLVFAPVQLRSVTEAALAHLGIDAGGPESWRRVDVEVPPTLEVSGDVAWLQRVFEDLLDNAMRFSPDDSVAKVSAEDGEQAVVVSVTDQGRGMAPEQLERAFEPFYTGDPARTRRNASGLGLSICRRVIERHGGRIWAESAGLGCGTSVRFTLPRSAPVMRSGRVQRTS